jgi:hypothetical protein
MNTIGTYVRGAGMSYVDVSSGNVLRQVRLITDRHVPTRIVTLQMSS